MKRKGSYFPVFRTIVLLRMGLDIFSELHSAMFLEVQFQASHNGVGPIDLEIPESAGNMLIQKYPSKQAQLSVAVAYYRMVVYCMRRAYVILSYGCNIQLPERVHCEIQHSC